MSPSSGLRRARSRARHREWSQGDTLPEMIDNAFVRALQEVLSGLQKAALDAGELRAVLARGGMPCTVGELEDRFKRHLTCLTRGKEPGKVRIVLE